LWSQLLTNLYVVMLQHCIQHSKLCLCCYLARCPQILFQASSGVQKNAHN